MNHLRILKCRLNVDSESVGLQYGLKILHFDTLQRDADVARLRTILLSSKDLDPV